ncbi:hypothetical protein IGB42_02270 [Andreprevotia sp. IGB-42]|nr:hypothetical protein IGB42_02270 [Andreprevotia sp. IGB-42]
MFKRVLYTFLVGVALGKISRALANRAASRSTQ